MTNSINPTAQNRTQPVPDPAHETLTIDLLSGILAAAQKAESDAKAGEPPPVPASVFQPRDALESILADLAAAHARLILKSVTEVLATPPSPARAKSQSHLVALDRALLGFLRELRIARKRPADTLAAPEPKPAPPRQAATARPAQTTRPAMPPAARIRPEGPQPTANAASLRRPHRDSLLSGASTLASAAILPPRMPAAAMA